MGNKGRAEAVKALEAARAAETGAASHRATAAQKQQQIAELEERKQIAVAQIPDGTSLRVARACKLPSPDARTLQS